MIKKKCFNNNLIIKHNIIFFNCLPFPLHFTISKLLIINFLTINSGVTLLLNVDMQNQSIFPNKSSNIP